MVDLSESYENYVCSKCYRTLNECNCTIIPYTLIHIDKAIQRHIQILRDKGYNTLFCCEGHYKNLSEIYISFAAEYNFNMPEGFKYSKTNRMLSYKFKKNIKKEQFDDTKNKMLSILLEWCNNLPNIRD